VLSSINLFGDTPIQIVHVSEEHDVYIGRGSIWGNPYTHKTGTLAKYKVGTRDEAIDLYEKYIIEGEGAHLLKHLDELRGKRLACFCKYSGKGKRCHGDILKKIVEKTFI
jgi:hypothetical protein